MTTSDTNTMKSSPKLPKKHCAYSECKKKLTIIEREYVCICGKCFCSKHRLPEDHCCRHNYIESTEIRERKSEALKCVASKVIKI